MWEANVTRAGGRGPSCLYPRPPMRKILPTLITFATLAVVPLAAGCGADDLNPDSVASAAESTREEKTAKVAMAVSVSGFGVPVPLSVQGKGKTALDAARMDLTMDLGPLLSLAGQQGDGATRLLVDGKDVFVKPPAIRGLQLPGGADWVGLDLVETVEAMGIDADGFGALVNADPGAQLEAIKSAKGVKEVGEEKIGGVDTTRFRGEVRIRDLIAALPADQRAAAQKAFDELLKDTPGGDAPQPIEVWIDDEERIRRTKQQVKAPAQQGVPAGRADITVDYSDFGTPLEVKAPASGDVFDATSALTRILRQQQGTTTN